MPRHRTIQIDEQPEEVKRFFHQIGDQPILVELAGQPVCILYPSHELHFTRTGTLADSAGSWNLPADVMRAMCGEDNP